MYMFWSVSSDAGRLDTLPLFVDSCTSGNWYSTVPNTAALASWNSVLPLLYSVSRDKYPAAPLSVAAPMVVVSPLLSVVCQDFSKASLLTPSVFLPPLPATSANTPSTRAATTMMATTFPLFLVLALLEDLTFLVLALLALLLDSGVPSPP